jgi:hypothetical protein
MHLKPYATALLLTFILSAVLTTVFFDPKDIISNDPAYSEDYAMHFSQCLSTKRFLSSHSKLWGYDPFFLAGYPRGTLVNADNKAWEILFCIVSPVIGPGRAFKLYILLFLLLYPFLTYLAARNFALSRETGLIASFLAILFFHLSLAIDFVSWGMVSYVFVCFFSLYVFSLMYKLCEEFTLRRYVALAVCSSLLLMMHILSPLPILIPVLLIYLLSIKRLKPLHHLLIFTIPLITILLNSFWLVTLNEFFGDKTTRPENYEFVLQIKNIFEPLKVYLMQHRSIPHKAPVLDNTFIDTILLVSGCYGLCVWYRKKCFHLVCAHAAGVFVIFIIAYYGSHVPFFAQFQPERFTICVSLLLIIPASIAIREVVPFLYVGRHWPSILFTICLCFVLLYGPVIRPFGMFFKHRPYRINCHVPEKITELLQFIKTHTTREGRILIEDSIYTPEDPLPQFYGGRFPALFPDFVTREYLCGPRPRYPVKHSFASFTRGELFEKDINLYTLSELKYMLKLFNVKWIVCWYDKSKNFFDRFPEYIHRLEVIDKFTIYEVNRKASYFLKGSGTVTADYNSLKLDNVIAEDGEIILSYHWMQKLTTVPSVKIERIFIAADPIGFIKISSPPTALMVINSY